MNDLFNNTQDQLDRIKQMLVQLTAPTSRAPLWLGKPLHQMRENIDHNWYPRSPAG